MGANKMEGEERNGLARLIGRVTTSLSAGFIFMCYLSRLRVRVIFGSNELYGKTGS